LKDNQETKGRKRTYVNPIRIYKDKRVIARIKNTKRRQTVIPRHLWGWGRRKKTRAGQFVSILHATKTFEYGYPGSGKQEKKLKGTSGILISLRPLVFLL